MRQNFRFLTFLLVLSRNFLDSYIDSYIDYYIDFSNIVSVFLLRQIGRSITTNWAVYYDKLGGLLRQIGRSIGTNTTVYCDKSGGLFREIRRSIVRNSTVYCEKSGGKKGGHPPPFFLSVVPSGSLPALHIPPHGDVCSMNQ